MITFMGCPNNKNALICFKHLIIVRVFCRICGLMFSVKSNGYVYKQLVRLGTFF